MSGHLKLEEGMTKERVALIFWDAMHCQFEVEPFGDSFESDYMETHCHVYVTSCNGSNDTNCIR